MSLLQGSSHSRVGATARFAMTVAVQVMLRWSPTVVTGGDGGVRVTLGGGRSGK